MRGMVDDLVNPHPLATALPAAYQGEAFTEAFLAALDEVIAPLLSTLDNVDAYLDPALAPADFLPWLGGWVGVELDENWSQAQQRRLLGQAVELLQWRGTRHGMVELVRHFLAIDVDRIEVTDTGGVAWSATPDGALPGSVPADVEVRVHCDDEVDRDRLDQLVSSVVPAHVGHHVEVVGR